MAKWSKWQDVPAGEQNQLKNLFDAWAQATGYTVDIPPDWALLEMANEGISSQYQFGQYMWDHTNTVAGQDLGSHFVNWYAQQWPWAAFGITQHEYNQDYEQFKDTMMEYIGQPSDEATFKWFMQQNGGQLTAATIRNFLMTNKTMQDWYGWLKYGLTYSEFQTQKQTMKSAFGRDLSDGEAATQLQYFHQASASSFAASAQPTLTQEQKKSAQVGLTGPGTAVR